MHPEVQMHQMLFWKMSLASIPGGGSREEGGRQIHAGGTWEEPGARAGRGRSEATALWGRACLPNTFSGVGHARQRTQFP